MVRSVIVSVGLAVLAGTAAASTAILSLPFDGNRVPTMSFVDLLASDGIAPGVTILDAYTDYYGKSDGENGAVLDLVDTPVGRASRGRSFGTGQLAYRTGYDASALYALTPYSSLTVTLPMYASVSAGRDGQATSSYYLNYSGSTQLPGSSVIRGETGFHLYSGLRYDDGSYVPPSSLRRDLSFTLTNDSSAPMIFGYGSRWSMSAEGPTVAPVPEPEAYGLMALGLAVTGWWARRKQRNIAGRGSPAAN